MTTVSPDPALARWGFSEWLAAARGSGEFIRTPELDDVNDAIISMDGRKLVNFSGIGILGWQHDPDVRTVFAELRAGRRRFPDRPGRLPAAPGTGGAGRGDHR
ncbi:MAG TPA: hypothetical protein VJ870_10565 [Amycolatopsis sp.]|nr:hypothetical protein [Amycolatopsis sp.]